jgi:hypothetical protein
MPRPSSETPIGELIIVNGQAPTFIGFYRSSASAQQFEPTAIRNAGPHGEVARHGDVIVLWTHRPSDQQRLIVEACAFA